MTDPRPALIDRLEAEAAAGWPVPWWPQDRAAADPSGLTAGQLDRLDRAIDMIASAFQTERQHNDD